LSPAECEQLLSIADGTAYEMILITLRTGMRQGEVKGLQWTAIDWENRMLTVRHSYCDVRKTLDTPKSNRERHIPLDIDVYEMLYRRKKNAGYVFLDRNEPFNSQRLNRRLGKACEKVGLRTITWHVLRHTFASHLASKGAPLAGYPQAIDVHYRLNQYAVGSIRRRKIRKRRISAGQFHTDETRYGCSIYELSSYGTPAYVCGVVE
jgi:integrase